MNLHYIFNKCLAKRKFKEQFFDFYFTPNYRCKIIPHQDYSVELPAEQEFWKNDPGALVHFVETPCKIRDFNSIVNYNKKVIEIKEGLRFVEIITESVDDA